MSVAGGKLIERISDLTKVTLDVCSRAGDRPLRLIEKIYFSHEFFFKKCQNVMQTCFVIFQ